MNDYVYSPLQSRPIAPLIYLGAAVPFGAFAFLSDQTLLPVFAMPSIWHVIFWFIVGTSPLLGLQVGWSYVLAEDALVVRRFGKEKYRLALGEYGGRSMSLGLPRLQFGSRRVYVVSGVDADRQAFLAELDTRVANAGGPVPLHLVEPAGAEGLRIRVSDLRLPPRCCVCGADAHAETEISARRGLDLVIARYQQVLSIGIPVCHAHARRFRMMRGGAWFTVYAIPTLAWVAQVAAEGTPPNGLLPVFLVGSVAGMLAMRLAEALGFRRLIDWHALGVAAIGLTPDLSVVTLRIASDELRRQLAAAAAETSPVPSGPGLPVRT